MPAATHTPLVWLSILAFVAVSLVAASAAAPPNRDREEPTTPQNLRVDAATSSSVTLAWDPSSDDIGVVGYYVFGDRGKATVDLNLDKPQYVVDGLGCGQSTQLSVIAFDNAGNRSERATAIVSASACIDTQPPSSPSGFTQAATTENAVVLAWQPSRDDVGVVGYGVYGNLERFASPTDPSVTLSGLACGRTYEYALDSVDAAGNRSQLAKAFVATSACSTSTPGDTQPPSTPSGLAAWNITQTSMALTWNASSDNAGVVGYDVYRNGVKVASPASTSASLSGLACATAYTFAVRARDAAGNVSSQATLDASTAACSTSTPGDTQPPSTPSGLKVSSASATSVTLAWNASTDNVRVTAYRTYRDGAYVSDDTQTASTVSGLACGSAYSFEVDAIDAAGNTSARASVIGSTQACPDTDAPTTPATVVANTRTATSIALTWAASWDDIGVAEYGLYRGGVNVGTALQTTAIFSGLTCGMSYTLAVDAADAAGNRSAKTTVLVSTLACPDTTAPSSPTGLAVSNITQTSLNLSWTASNDNVGVTSYDVYRSGTKMSTVVSTSSSQTGLVCGTTYSLGVVARDASGNSSSQASLLVSTAACSPAPSPAPGGCGVDPATMTAPGCTLLRDDTSSQADPRSGLWGTIECGTTWPNQDPSRQVLRTTGGDTNLRANGQPQGNMSYRELTVHDGDNYSGERCELGRNWYEQGENSGTATSGTFSLYREGERKITFWSMRFGSGFRTDVSSWQTIMQMKQAMPYGGNGPVNGAPALELQASQGLLRVCSFWSTAWTSPVPAVGTWFRVAFDVTYSQDPAKGKLQVFVDRDGDGDADDVSPVVTMRTLAYSTSPGAGSLSNGSSIPGHLRLGVYHDAALYGDATVHVDNVQVVAG